MMKTFPRWILYVAAFLLYVLHNDLWFWNDPRLVLGLPIGLLYHVAFCLAASALMVFLVIYAWPEKLEVEEEREEE
ncbi:hypothetical protein MYX78_00360 [Acidobacteria bacterium AH-259-G07]|nr:hypothetical protein [Acidobacteria bacterium AH-259-G07]MDA2938359.1 hypothetical protein [Acidobacteria bacterium AH-259-A15]